MKKIGYAVISLIVACNVVAERVNVSNTVSVSKSQSDGNKQTGKGYKAKLYEVDYVIKQFEENEIFAEDELLHKVMFLAGKFDSLSKSQVDDGYNLKLDWMNNNPFTLSISCNFSKSKRNDLRNLKKGDTLIIKGILSRDFLGFLQLVGCSIEAVNPKHISIDKDDN